MFILGAFITTDSDPLRPNSFSSDHQTRWYSISVGNPDPPNNRLQATRKSRAPEPQRYMKWIENKLMREKSNIAVMILGVIAIILGIVILRNHIFAMVYLITTGDDSGTLSGLHGAIAANIIGIIIQSCCVISAMDFIKYYNWARRFLCVYCIFQIFSFIFAIIFSKIFELGDRPSILGYLTIIYSLVFLRFSSYPRIKEKFK